MWGQRVSLLHPPLTLSPVERKGDRPLSWELAQSPIATHSIDPDRSIERSSVAISPRTSVKLKRATKCRQKAPAASLAGKFYSPPSPAPLHSWAVLRALKSSLPETLSSRWGSSGPVSTSFSRFLLYVSPPGDWSDEWARLQLESHTGVSRGWVSKSTSLSESRFPCYKPEDSLAFQINLEILRVCACGCVLCTHMCPHVCRM